MKHLLKLRVMGKPDDVEDFCEFLEKNNQYKIRNLSTAFEQHNTNIYKRYYIELENTKKS